MFDPTRCLPWFKSHRALHEVNGIIGHAFKKLVGERQVALCDVKESFLFVVTSERAVAWEKNVGKNANWPDVSFQRQRFILDDFWRDIIGSALNLANILRAFNGTRKTKVAKFKSIWESQVLFTNCLSAVASADSPSKLLEFSRIFCGLMSRCATFRRCR